jgi:hypothetical protein
MLMFDAATKFRLRILAPDVCLPVDPDGVCRRLAAEKESSAGRPADVCIPRFSAYKQVNTINFWSRGGLGYASFQWYDSKAMAYLRELPEDMRIYTDEPAAVYLYTGRGNYVLPSRYDSATALATGGLRGEAGSMKDQEILDGQAVLAIFKGRWSR